VRKQEGCAAPPGRGLRECRTWGSLLVASPRLHAGTPPGCKSHERDKVEEWQDGDAHAVEIVDYH
jgi:hypothetical protein